MVSSFLLICYVKLRHICLGKMSVRNFFFLQAVNYSVIKLERNFIFLNLLMQ